MFTKTISSSDGTRAFMLSSHHVRSKTRSKRLQHPERSQAVHNTKSYADGLQRAFNRVKKQVFFNPDMKYFVTLTYKGKNHTIEDVMSDMKIFLKNQKRKTGENLKYVWVAEYQKRGSIHVHMITNAKFKTHTNKNGYQSLTDWTHGFTSVLEIEDFDDNFRPYLYLFKYMRKAERIGKSFVHSSRNISLTSSVEVVNNDEIMEQYYVQHQERSFCKPENLKNGLTFYQYFLIRDKLAPAPTSITSKPFLDKNNVGVIT